MARIVARILKERENSIKTAFLAALDAATAQRRAVSNSPQAKNYAPRFFVDNDLSSGFTVKELAKAMRALFNDGEIIANQALWRGPNRHQVMGIARKSIADPALRHPRFGWATEAQRLKRTPAQHVRVSVPLFRGGTNTRAHAGRDAPEMPATTEAQDGGPCRLD